MKFSGCTLAILPTTACTSKRDKSNRSHKDLSLRRGPTELILKPALGGSIVSLTYQQRHILRPSPPNITDVRQSAYFPLVPVCNRIANAKFEFNGRVVKLTPNHYDQTDHFHGLGWKTPWTVKVYSETTAELEFYHPRSEWPWTFLSKQRFLLGSDSLRITLSVTNLDRDPMPASLGFHPYFPRTALTQLVTGYDGHWTTDKTGDAMSWRPGPAGRDYRIPASLEGVNTLDTTHSQFSGAAVISEAGRPTIMISASENLDKVHIFSPHDRNFFCVEPVMNHPAPFKNKKSGLYTLHPEETLSAWISISMKN